MDPWILLALLVLSLAAFLVFIPPNRAASHNLSLVTMYEPDEGIVGYVLDMVSPKADLKEFAKGFLFYGFYSYGFPYFCLSALVLLPLQALGRIGDLTLVMATLRQLVSVLPLLLGLLVLVYLQDGFRSLRSPLLYALLLLVPAVWSNNTWWHPDGLTFLLVTLVLFFLWRDDLRLGRDFLAAAFLCGITVATKVVGVYFFLAVGLVLLLARFQRRLPWRRVLGMALLFLLVMAAAFWVSNPYLFWRGARNSYFAVLFKETGEVTRGYGVEYARGLAAAWPDLSAAYGSAPFLLLALGAAAWGVLRGPRRLLGALILAWFLPVSILVLAVTHFKFQYWLPAALPLLSCLAPVLPDRLAPPAGKAPLRWILRGAMLALVGVQAFLFLQADLRAYDLRLNRAVNDPRLKFYEQAVQALQPLGDAPLSVYYDYRMYAPLVKGWSVDTNFKMLDYAYIQRRDFDVLLLLQQRIMDYLDPNAVGIDPQQLARSQEFYRAADRGSLSGYRLVYRDPVGLVYVREDLYESRY